MPVYLILVVSILVYLRIPPTEIRTIMRLKASNEAIFFSVFFWVMGLERKRDLGDSDVRDKGQLRSLTSYRFCLNRDKFTEPSSWL